MCILFTERRTGMKRMKYYSTKLMALLIAMCLAMSGIIFTASASKADEATDVTEEEFYDEEFEEEDEEEEDEDDYEIDEVVNFCASKIAKKSVTLKWSKVSDIDGYELQYKKASSGKWITKELSASKTSYKVTKLKVGTKYNFRIRAFISYEEDEDEEDWEDEEEIDLSDVEYDEDYEEDEDWEDEEDEEWDDYEYGGYAKMTLKTLNKDGSGDKSAVSDKYENSAPKHVKATKLTSVKAKDTSAVIKWKLSAKASGYELYMSTKKTSGFKKITTVKKAKTLTFTKKGLKEGKTYYFKIRAFVKNGKQTSYTKYSGVKTLKIK